MDEVYATGQDGRAIQLKRIRSAGWTKAKRKRFLDALAATCNVQMAARAAGVARYNAYNLRKRDPQFAALWQDALVMGYETLETALLEQALHGVNAIEIVPTDDLDPFGPMVPATVANARKRSDTPDDTAAGGSSDSSVAAEPVAPGSGLTVGPLADPVSVTRLQFALALLNRHRGAVEHGGRRVKAVRTGTAADTDAYLRKRLDALAKRLGEVPPGDGPADEERSGKCRSGGARSGGAPA